MGHVFPRHGTGTGYVCLSNGEASLGGVIMRTLVIIPTYNEQENLEPLTTTVLALNPSIDVLVVDDQSPDGTGELAEHLAQETGRVGVIHRAGKLGLGTAYLAGFRY